jgi:hypothetical protein
MDVPIGTTAAAAAAGGGAVAVAAILRFSKGTGSSFKRRKACESKCAKDYGVFALLP